MPPNSYSTSNRELTDALYDVLGGIAKFLFILGGACFVLGAGYLLYVLFGLGSLTAGQIQQASNTVDIVSKILLAGTFGLAIGASYTFWGEELTGAIILMLGGALYGTPYYLTASNEAGNNALQSLQSSGLWLGIVGIVVILIDVATRVNSRAKKGAKKDTIKIGKGAVREEKYQNVLLGKCWQLPFCRKFVREKCPIYHSKRTCWKELVGCMCEEEVIRGALENRVIPKDEIAAAALIPRNNKLTFEQKRRRCKDCVIYNEHIRHKYRVTVPVVLVAYTLVFALMHGPILEALDQLVIKTNAMVHSATFTANTNQHDVSMPIAWVLFGFVYIVVVSYSLRFVEFLYFTLKV